MFQPEYIAQKTARRIAEFLQERTGEGLRTVVLVRRDDWEIHYLRDDLSAEYTQESFGEVVDAFQPEEPRLSPDTGDRPVGERRGVVHYHEEAFVVQFPLPDAKSILISLTPEAGRDLLTFMKRCRTVIEEAA